MPHYSSSNYDECLCLRPPLLLWIVALYFSRAMVLPFAMVIGSFAGLSADATRLLGGLRSPHTLGASLLAIPVLYVLCWRVPNASEAVRWIWRHGRLLLSAAAVLDLALVGVPLLLQGNLNVPALPSLLTALIDGYFLAYILAVRRVRDTFADFPLAASQH